MSIWEPWSSGQQKLDVQLWEEVKSCRSRVPAIQFLFSILNIENWSGKLQGRVPAKPSWTSCHYNLGGGNLDLNHNSLGKGFRVFDLHQVDDDERTCLLKALVIAHLRFWSPSPLLKTPTPSSKPSSKLSLLIVTVQKTCWRRGSLLSSGSFFVKLAIIEGNSLYICSGEDHDGEDHSFV